MPLKEILAMEAAHRDGIALTFDDVRLKTRYSIRLPHQVDLTSRFSRNVGLKVPIVSSPMDTVTEKDMAIEMAKLGGLGILHKNLNDKELLDQFYKVKFHLHGQITSPVTISPNQTVAEFKAWKDREGYRFNTFPVTRDGKFVGLISRSDLQFCRDDSKLIADIMTDEPIIGKPGMSAGDAYEQMIQHKKKVLPLIDESGKVAGMYTWTDVDRIMRGEANRYNTDESGRLRVGIAAGPRKDLDKFLDAFVQHGLDVVVLDSAHADTLNMMSALESIKRNFPKLDVVVGNISEADSALRLADLGADGLRVGQGGGSICTTRIVAGIGCPQVTAVYTIARALEKAGFKDVPVCSDGGIRYSGDIPVAIGAGAHSVMIGLVLAGTDEAPGDEIIHEGRRLKTYRGMGSEGAMKDHKSSRERYNQDSLSPEKSVPEGVEAAVEIKGPVSKTFYRFVGGFRNGMGYVGAKDIEELRNKADFWRHTSAGKEESHPHDVTLIREPSNYTPRGKK